MPYIDTKNFDIFYDVWDIRIEAPLFEVDEFIAPIISLLNKKGYKTQYCCSGHINSSKQNGSSLPHDSCYIKFEEKSFEDIINLPKGFIFEDGLTIRKNYEDFNILDDFCKYCEIINTMQELYTWVKYEL